MLKKKIKKLAIIFDFDESLSIVIKLKHRLFTTLLNHMEKILAS